MTVSVKVNFLSNRYLLVVKLNKLIKQIFVKKSKNVSNVDQSKLQT